MTSPLNELQDLIKLTQSYIIEEFNKEETVFSEKETYNFFLEYYQNYKNSITTQPASQPTPAIQKQTSPLPAQPTEPTSQAVPMHKQAPKTLPLPSQQEIKSAEPAAKEPSPQAMQQEKKFTQLFALEEFKNSHPIDLSSIKKEIITLFPNLALLQQLPNDSDAKKIANQWKLTKMLPEVILLSFNENQTEIAFLQKVTQAITDKLCPASLYSAQTIESQNKWMGMFKMSQLKLILCPDYGIHSCNGLIKNFDKTAQTLGGIPVLLLPDLSLYLRQPSLKAALWQAICAKMKTR